MNLYTANNPLGRPDALRLYSDATFRPASLLASFRGGADNDPAGFVALPTHSTTLGLHLRATAADGEFGFVAEVSTLPSTPDSRNVEEMAVRNSRFEDNDRGAVLYRNLGEVGPNLVLEQCLAQRNGYFLFGNVSTSMQAMELHLHNTVVSVGLKCGWNGAKF